MRALALLKLGVGLDRMYAKSCFFWLQLCNVLMLLKTPLPLLVVDVVCSCIVVVTPLVVAESIIFRWG